MYFTFEVNGFDVGDFGVGRFDLKERYNELFELNLLVVTESGRQLDFYSLLDRRGVFKVWEGGASTKCLRDNQCDTPTVMGDAYREL